MILSYQDLRDAVSGVQPVIKTKNSIDGRIQPSSFDCVLLDHAYRVSSSFLPKEDETVMEAIERYCLFDFRIKEEGSIFEPRCSYIIPLEEELNLPSGWFCSSSPKSSAGRIDLFVRMLADGCGQYDVTAKGYKGPIYLEVIPLSFVTSIAPNLSLNQIRVNTNNGCGFLSDEEIALMHSKYGIALDQKEKIMALDELKIMEQGVFLSVDLLAEIIGYKAKDCSDKVLHLTKDISNLKEDFFEPIKRSNNDSLILFPGDFYLLASSERIRVPPEFSGTLIPYYAPQGEIRTHYAGYFDNGFGYGQGGEWKGTTAVFEVRAHTVPFRLTHGQFLGKMVYEKTLHTPDVLYGHDLLNSHYMSVGPRLSKYVKGEW